MICRFYRLTLLAALLLTIAVGSAATTPESLYRLFLDNRGNRQVTIANELMDTLLNNNITDQPISFTIADNSAMMFNVNYWMAEYFYAHALYSEAVRAGQAAIPAAKQLNNLVEKSDLLNIIGISYFRKGEYEHALRFFDAALHIDRQLDDRERISSDLNNMASIYLSTQQSEQGLNLIRQAIDIERQLNRPQALAIRLGIASELMLIKGDPDQAMILISEAYELDCATGNSIKIAIRQSQLAEVLLARHKTHEAEQLLLAAIDTLQARQQFNSIAICHEQLGRICSISGRTAQAAQHFRKTIDLCLQSGNRPLQRKAHHALYILLANSDPAEAHRQLQQYADLTDTLLNKTTAQLPDITLNNEYTDSLLQSLPQHNTSELIAWTLLVFALITIAILWWHNRQKSKPHASTADDITPTDIAAQTHITDIPTVSIDNIGFAPTNATQHNFLQQLLTALNLMLKENKPANYDNLAITMRLNQANLRQQAEKASGLHPNALLTRLRLHIANHLLIYSSMNIQQISNYCQFQRQNYFSVCFKDTYGLTPSQYRKKYRNSTATD